MRRRRLLGRWMKDEDESQDNLTAHITETKKVVLVVVVKVVKLFREI
jgi:hypothetical protein